MTFDGSNDNPMWCLTTNESFTIKSFYKQLLKYDGNSFTLSFRQIWKARAPPLVFFFAWEASRECIIIIYKLRRWGKNICEHLLTL